MKRVFLLIVIPALLVALGFAQTPAASSNTDQVNIKGCLGGSDGNYTVAEDNTGKIFKITTSSADLKPHLGHDVNLTGQKAGDAENSLAVTQLNMISEHCAAAAAAPAVAAPAATAPAPTVSAPSETVTAPAVAAAAPAVAAPAPTVSTPAETVSVPPAAAAPVVAPEATVSIPVETASAPAAPAKVHPTRRSARPRKAPETPAAADVPAETASAPAANAPVPVAPVSPSSEDANSPAAPVAPAAKASTSRSAGMLVSIVVVVLLIGAGVPLYNRWRKRKLLEETKGENLSFTNKAISDPGKSNKTGGSKAA